MVKHDVEVESSGECVDEIDKLTEVIGKHEADQYCLNASSRSQFNILLKPLLLHPPVIEGQRVDRGLFQSEAKIFMSSLGYIQRIPLFGSSKESLHLFFKLWWFVLLL
ncbi:hypothetical protein Tco_0218101 [Tanacetum coccineum]